jgi:flagellar hook protein FlgE
MSFQQGLSGLNAAARNLDVIGNNVANSTTIGFKQGEAVFGDVFAASFGGGAGTQIGIGTQFKSVTQHFSQGSITVSNNPLDVAINGQGFYRMSTGGVISYTRNGGFSLDKEGFIVGSSGQNLTGYQAVGGTIVPNVLGNLRLNAADLAPIPTSTTQIGANLSSADPILPTAGLVTTDPKSYNYSTAATTYDSLGNVHTMNLYFNKTAPNTWDTSIYIDGTLANGAGGPSSLTFTNTGDFSAATNLVKTATLTNGASPLSITMDFTKMSQYGTKFGVSSLSQNGYTSGSLSGYSVGTDGIIVGNYSNGLTQQLGQIALSNFTNPQGLSSMGNGMWIETSQSGIALTGAPNTASLGSLQSLAKEDSNVDLTSELVNMITAQRVYQANAQTIKTQDQLLQTLVNLK